MKRIFLITLFLLAGLALISQNTQQDVILQYFLGYSSPAIPLYQLVGGAFILGMFLTGVFILPDWIRMRRELKRYRKNLQEIVEKAESFRPDLPAVPPTRHRPKPSMDKMGSEMDKNIT